MSTRTATSGGLLTISEVPDVCNGLALCGHQSDNVAASGLRKRLRSIGGRKWRVNRPPRRPLVELAGDCQTLVLLDSPVPADVCLAPAGGSAAGHTRTTQEPARAMAPQPIVTRARMITRTRCITRARDYELSQSLMPSARSCRRTARLRFHRRCGSRRLLAARRRLGH